MKRRTVIKNTALLFGTAFSSSIAATLLSGCQSGAGVGGQLGWTPVFLDQLQARLLQRIAGIMIPETDIAGAVGMGIPQALDAFAKTYMPPNEQAQFTQGLTTLNSDCKKAMGQPFLDLDDAQQLIFLQAEEKKLVANPDPRQLTFLGTLKKLVYEAYFSSEVGATEVLKYDPVPGGFSGCIPFSEVNGTWVSFDMSPL
ncbi:MAG: gluconate 2-dehydrogenase subunit 3 family protein [Bacteroidota bacterium]